MIAPIPIADGATSPIDQGLDTILLIAALFFGLVAVLRLRGRGFRRLPAAWGWAAGGLAVASVVVAFVLPPIVRPDVKSSSSRPSTSARISFVSPRPGQVFVGNPATVDVQLRLVGGRIVPFTSTKLVPNAGHVHLYLDGSLVAMTFGLRQRISVGPGTHGLEADFVAVDHGPFDPPVLARVTFDVRAR